MIVDERKRGAAPIGARGCYFFLSYAHTPPTGRVGAADPDDIVDRFFEDLSRAVEGLRTRPELDIGFCDRQLSPGSDRRRHSDAALGAAEVLVPLYAPRYFANAATGRELTAFHQRLAAQGLETPARQVVPVRWSPLPPGYQIPYSAAFPEATDDVEGYRDNGLQALYRLVRYRNSYEEVVACTARAIVRTAERSPSVPGSVPEVDADDLFFPRRQETPRFAIVVAAATADGLPYPPASRAATDWRPFGRDEELPLGDYAGTIAERLGFAVHVSPIESKTSDPFGSSPGVVLVDPWLADSTAGRSLLESIARDFPVWALPLLVGVGSSRAAPQRVAALADVARDLLAVGAPSPGEGARRATDPVRSIADFDRVFPILVTDAARRYLRDGPVPAPDGGTTNRPRIFSEQATDPSRVQEERGD